MHVYGAVERINGPEAPEQPQRLQERTMHSRVLAVLGSAALVALAGLAALAGKPTKPMPAASPVSLDTLGTLDTLGALNKRHGKLRFESYNSYSASASYEVGAQYSWITPSLLVEPHRDSTFNVTHFLDLAEYKWHIESESKGSEFFTGPSFVYKCKLPGKLNVTLTESVHDEGTGENRSRSIQADVQCRYVRREIRTLSKHDSKRFVEAMQTVYTMSETEGRARYGHRFTGITSFVDAHNTLAGNQYCDHMHDGYGFMNQHVALTRWFEYVLQLIEPAVSMPYWDYTVEGQKVNRTGDITPWQDSVYFSEDWFGSVNDWGAVKTGKFAYTTSYYMAKNVSNTANAYGFMRAPWNQNKIPYVSRFNISYGFQFTAPPDCESHYTALQYDTWSTFGKEIMYAPHGPVHLMIGGIANADWQDVLKRLNVNFHIAMLWAPSGFSVQKNMFRDGKLSCPDTCSLDTPMEDCKCVCPELDDWLSFPEHELKSSILSLIFGNNSYFYEDKWGGFIGYDILKLLCNSHDKMAPIFGESLESASPGDPSFWPIHPTAERLFAWRRIKGLHETHWIDNAAWSVRGYTTDYCWGHNYDDVLSWPSYLFEQTGWAGPYSNGDIWTLTNPQESYLPYIYDNFYWPHCVSSGFSDTLI